MKIIHYIGLVALAVSSLQACTVKKTISADQQQKIDFAAVKINLQERKVFGFEKEGVFFSNDFASARLNALARVNDSTFNISIEAENRPINPSPWFAFKVWGTDKKNVYVNLNYPTTKHRYKPKVSIDGLVWDNLESVIATSDKKQASFKVQLGKDTLIVAAQEIISAHQSYQWMDSLVNKNGLKKRVIGSSIGGKPIMALETAKSNGKKIVVVISRQHPPEVSGYMAMTAFIETLLGNTALAKAFVKEYELVVIPMVNPDGVDEGNWRHSFAGVDLNRDWIDFKQPETSAIKDYLLSKVKKQNAKVYFAADFHSTFNDVLYTNLESTPTNQPGLVEAWVKELHNFQGDDKIPVQPSPNTNTMSKAWFGRVLNAEALIYEVGDNTPRAEIKQTAQKAAEILMQQLVKK